MMAALFALLIYKVLKRKEIIAPHKNRLSLLLTMISMAAGLLMICLSFYIGYSAMSEKTLFNLSVNVAGPVFSAILLTVWLLNLMLLIAEGYRAVKDKTSVHYGFFAFGFCIGVIVNQDTYRQYDCS